MVVVGISNVQNDIHGSKEASSWFVLFLRIANQLWAYHNQLYWNVHYIYKHAWTRNSITHVKADQQGRGEGLAVVLGNGAKQSCQVLKTAFIVHPILDK